MRRIVGADSPIDPERPCGATVCRGDGLQLSQLVPARVERKLRLLMAAAFNGGGVEPRGDSLTHVSCSLIRDGGACAAALLDVSHLLFGLI